MHQLQTTYQVILGTEFQLFYATMSAILNGTFTGKGELSCYLPRLWTSDVVYPAEHGTC